MQTATQELKVNSTFCFLEGSLTIKLSGHGQADGWSEWSFKEDQVEISPDGYALIEMAPSELRELRDFLNRTLSSPNGIKP